MNVGNVSALPHSGSVTPPIRPGAGEGAAPFSEAIADVLRNVNGQQLHAQQQVTDLATGATDNLHEVVLSVAEADLAFQMVVELRNRLIASYQELMRMQV